MKFKRGLIYISLLLFPFISLLFPETTRIEIILTGVSISIVVIIFLESRRSEIKALIINNYLEISQMYERVQNLRVQIPNIAQKALKWNDTTWDLIYQDTEEGREWYQYYGYAEECLNFCMMTHHLYAYENAISEHIYQNIFNSLINLLIFENRWFFTSLLRVSKFLPKETRAFLEVRLKEFSDN
ncbi:MAG: hypothetical protein ACTSRS_04850 [Candidatus Helarchaeota archaeon]